jgi:hypothetical protein
MRYDSGGGLASVAEGGGGPPVRDGTLEPGYGDVGNPLSPPPMLSALGFLGLLNAAADIVLVPSAGGVMTPLAVELRETLDRLAVNERWSLSGDTRGEVIGEAAVVWKRGTWYPTLGDGGPPWKREERGLGPRCELVSSG